MQVKKHTHVWHMMMAHHDFWMAPNLNCSFFDQLTIGSFTKVHWYCNEKQAAQVWDQEDNSSI
jgi:hypothetical protein